MDVYESKLEELTRKLSVINAENETIALKSRNRSPESRLRKSYNQRLNNKYGAGSSRSASVAAGYSSPSAKFSSQDQVATRPKSALAAATQTIDGSRIEIDSKTGSFSGFGKRGQMVNHCSTCRCSYRTMARGRKKAYVCTVKDIEMTDARGSGSNGSDLGHVRVHPDIPEVLNFLKKQQAEHSEETDRMRRIFAELQASLSEEQDRVLRKDAEITRLRQALSGETGSRRGTEISQQKSIDSLRQEVANLQRTCRDLEIDLKSGREKLTSREADFDNERQNMNSMLKQKDERIEELESDIRRKQQELDDAILMRESYSNKLHDAERKITDLEATLFDSDMKMRDLNHNVELLQAREKDLLAEVQLLRRTRIVSTSRNSSSKVVEHHDFTKKDMSYVSNLSNRSTIGSLKYPDTAASDQKYNISHTKLISSVDQARPSPKNSSIPPTSSIITPRFSAKEFAKALEDHDLLSPPNVIPRTVSALSLSRDNNLLEAPATNTTQFSSVAGVGVDDFSRRHGLTTSYERNDPSSEFAAINRRTSASTNDLTELRNQYGREGVAGGEHGGSRHRFNRYCPVCRALHKGLQSCKGPGFSSDDNKSTVSLTKYNDILLENEKLSEAVKFLETKISALRSSHVKKGHYDSPAIQNDWNRIKSLESTIGELRAKLRAAEGARLNCENKLDKALRDLNSKRTDLSLASSDVSHIQNSRLELQGLLAAKSREVEELRERLKAKDAEINGLQTELRKEMRFRESISSQESTFTSLKGDLGVNNRLRLEAEERGRSLMAENESLKKQLASSAAENRMIQDEKASLGEKLAGMQARLDEHIMKIAFYEDALKLKESERSNLLEVYDKTGAVRNQGDGQLNSNMRSSLEHQISELGLSVNEKDREIAHLRCELGGLSRHRDRLLEELEELRSQLAKLSASLETMKASLVGLQTKNSQLTEDLLAVRRNYAQLESKQSQTARSSSKNSEENSSHLRLEAALAESKHRENELVMLVRQNELEIAELRSRLSGKERSPTR